MTRDPGDTLNRFKEIESGFLAKSEKPRVGVICLRVPLELIESCGAVPVRITSESGLESSGSFGIRNDACSFCHSVPDLLHLDRFKNLVAIIGGACCDQMRRLMDTLHSNLSIPVILFGAPRTFGTDEDYFMGEMTRALRKLEKAVGSCLDEVLLPGIIAERDLLRVKIREMRDSGSLPTQLLRQIASSPLPAGVMTDFLANKLSTDLQPTSSVRLALIGSIPSGKELSIIEEVGGKVVADLTCLGDRAFRPVVEYFDNPFRTLYYHYIENNLCPHRRPYERLIDYAREMIALRKVEGIVFRYLKYCHPFGLSALRFRKKLNLPFLELDDDLTLQATGSFRTRIGAFVESIEARMRKRT